MRQRPPSGFSIKLRRLPPLCWGQGSADAIAAGEMELRSSTIWTDQGVDTGSTLVISEPVPVTLPCKLGGNHRPRAPCRGWADLHPGTAGRKQ